MEKRKCLSVILWKKQSGASETLILLLQLKAERGSHWQPVTGHVEEGESYAEAALREAEEETGFHFERQPQYLGLEYCFEGRFGQAREKAFALWIHGEQAPIPTLDPREHIAFAWLPPAEALLKVHYPTNREAIERASKPTPPLFLTRTGRWVQEGEEITHERTAELLHRSLLATAGEGYLVRLGSEEAEVILEAAPRFVQSFDSQKGEIKLLGGFSELLNPSTLQIQASDNSLSCQLTNGWRAIFLSPAYYEITKEIREIKNQKSGSTQYFLHFLGRDYEIPIPSERKGMNS